MEYYEYDAPKYRKKSKKKTPKKANHKHEWEPVILEYYNKNRDFDRERGFVGGRDFCRGSRCVICQKLALGFPDGVDFTPDDWPKLRFYPLKNLVAAHPEIEHIWVDDPYSI